MKGYNRAVTGLPDCKRIETSSPVAHRGTQGLHKVASPREPYRLVETNVIKGRKVVGGRDVVRLLVVSGHEERLDGLGVQE